MKNHKYKLATLVLSTGLLLSACGTDDAEEPEGQTDDTTVEESDEAGDATDDTTEDDPAGEIVEDADPDMTQDEEAEDETAEEDGETDDTTETTETTGVAVLDQLGSTPEEAVSAAQENFDGELVELELDEEGSDWVYKVTMESDSEEYEVKLHADDLSVLSEETESEDDNDTEDRFSYEDAIPHDEAVQTALDEVGGELEGWTLDMDDGQLEYEVELRNTDSGNDVDVTINAESGEVIEIDD